MLISVVGTNGLGSVPGVPADRPAALLEVVASRPEQAVLVLTPRHAEHAACRQADLLIAARPTARVRVVVSPHHALTLTVVADRALRSGVASGEDAAQAVGALLDRARSLVWCPTLWRLGVVGPGLLARLRSLADDPGFVLELGASGRLGTPRHDWRSGSDHRLYGAETPPELLARQLGPSGLQLVGTRIHPGAPYAFKGVHLLTEIPPEATRAPSTERPAQPQPAQAEPLTTHENENENESEAA